MDIPWQRYPAWTVAAKRDFSTHIDPASEGFAFSEQQAASTDYVDLMLCASPKTLAGAENDKAKVDIIHKPPSIWKYSQGDIQRPIIVVLPVFVRLHRKSTTDVASSGNRQIPEIMTTSYNRLLWKSRSAHGFRDNSPWQLHIIRWST